MIRKIKKNQKIIKIQNSVKAKEITQLTREIATLISAGIPLIQALQLLIKSSKKIKIAQLLVTLKYHLERGYSLTATLKFYPKLFDVLYCGLIEAAEASGTLDETLLHIANLREKKEALKKQVMRSLYYPVAVLSVALVACLIMILKVLPTFKDLYANFGATLPWLTQTVLNFSSKLQHYALFVFLAFLLIGVAIKLGVSRSQGFRHRLESCLIRLPGFGPLLQKSELAHLSHTLGLSLNAGVPLVQALRITTQTLSLSIFRTGVRNLEKNVLKGRSLTESMQNSSVFTPLVIQLISVGEASGKLEEMFTRVARLYETELALEFASLTQWIEPLMIILLGILLGGLIIAMYLPIFNLGGIF